MQSQNRLTAASDKVYQLLARGRSASSTTKTGRHDIAESGAKHQKSSIINQSQKICCTVGFLGGVRIL